MVGWIASLFLEPGEPRIERAFAFALRQEVGAELRRAQNLTQQQLADELEVTQQVVASYEIGRRRVPVSALPALARVLGVSIEGLIGEDEKPARRGPSPKLQRHLERIRALPKPKQRAVMEVLEAVLAQSSR